ncbi:hypothetical protein HPB49_003752 [Dermacentor silvarum]|uniref:Uncharacterized protein n=1 Tax=Dermacentor silvarum TaxID=543639 RepID=A0ACB8DU36_DERSI|nr:hypothetical protein HPB49_003752 [Dermacentor silvarum]
MLISHHVPLASNAAQSHKTAPAPPKQGLRPRSHCSRARAQQFLSGSEMARPRVIRVLLKSRQLSINNAPSRTRNELVYALPMLQLGHKNRLVQPSASSSRVPSKVFDEMGATPKVEFIKEYRNRELAKLLNVAKETVVLLEKRREKEKVIRDLALPQLFRLVETNQQLIGIVAKNQERAVEMMEAIMTPGYHLTLQGPAVDLTGHDESVTPEHSGLRQDDVDHVMTALELQPPSERSYAHFATSLEPLDALREVTVASARGDGTLESLVNFGHMKPASERASTSKAHHGDAKRESILNEKGNSTKRALSCAKNAFGAGKQRRRPAREADGAEAHQKFIHSPKKPEPRVVVAASSTGDKGAEPPTTLRRSNRHVERKSYKEPRINAKLQRQPGLAVQRADKLESTVADQMVRVDAVQLGEDALLGVVAELAEAGGGAAGQVLGLWLTGSDSL